MQYINGRLLGDYVLFYNRNFIHMHKHVKIPFRTGTITHSYLQIEVTNWIRAIDVGLFIHRNSFKYFPQFVVDLDERFTIAALLYSIKKRLPGLFEDNDTILVELSAQLKDYYTLLNMGTMKKKDSFFYFLCIYLTKLTINFLEDTFTDILAQTHLQCEIYIALVHVMIGLEVSPKSYEVNHKKVISDRYVVKSKVYLVSKTESIESVVSKSSNKRINYLQNPIRKFQQKMTLERKATHDFREEPSDLQKFRTSLRENLLVQMLPKIPPKKIKASQFDRMTDLMEAEKAGDERKYVFSRDDNQIVKPNQTFLNSTQNSAAFQTFFRAKNQVVCSMHKTVKISHRPQILNHKPPRFQKLLNEVSATQINLQSDTISNSQTSRKNWTKVVRNLKQNQLNTTKYELKSKWCETAPQTPEMLTKSNSIALNSEQVRKKQNKEGDSQQYSQNEYGFFVKSRDLRTCQMDGQQAFVHKEKENSNRLKSHRYRMERKVFDSLCNKRQSEINYSMFNLRNATTIFNPRLK